MPATTNFVCFVLIKSSALMPARGGMRWLTRACSNTLAKLLGVLMRWTVFDWKEKGKMVGWGHTALLADISLWLDGAAGELAPWAGRELPEEQQLTEKCAAVKSIPGNTPVDVRSSLHAAAR